jgi:8-oxo-dGTP diphosphatase
VSVAAPVVAAILAARDEAGRVLLVRQKSGPFADEWVLPGGRVEAGERIDQAMRREVREETGLAVVDARPIERYEVRSTGAEEFRLHVHLFRGVVAGDLRPEEGSAAAWTNLAAIDLHPVLAQELVDAGLLRLDPREITERLRARGVRMTALGLAVDEASDAR